MLVVVVVLGVVAPLTMYAIALARSEVCGMWGDDAAQHNVPFFK